MGAACAREQPSFAPPAQRTPVDTPDPGQLFSFVEMSSQFASGHIVRDIDPNPGGWRWAQARPQLQFAVPAGARLKFAAHVGIAGATFKTTGPVTITCSINGRRIGATNCPRDGLYHLAYNVPRGWLAAGSRAEVDLVADKLWVAPTDGVRLSYMLFSAGFAP
jgi:hypothetical protein